LNAMRAVIREKTSNDIVVKGVLEPRRSVFGVF